MVLKGALVVRLLHNCRAIGGRVIGVRAIGGRKAAVGAAYAREVDGSARGTVGFIHSFIPPSPLCNTDMPHLDGYTVMHI